MDGWISSKKTSKCAREAGMDIVGKVDVVMHTAWRREATCRRRSLPTATMDGDTLFHLPYCTSIDASLPQVFPLPTGTDIRPDVFFPRHIPPSTPRLLTLSAPHRISDLEDKAMHLLMSS